MKESFKALLDDSNPKRSELIFSGNWQERSKTTARELLRELTVDHQIGAVVVINASKLSNWDSSFVALLYALILELEEKQIDCDLSNCDPGIVKLLELARAVPPKEKQTSKRNTILEIIGKRAIKFRKQSKDVLEFIGECAVATLRLFTGRSRVSRDDLLLILKESGPDALPIVTLISLLVGLILAFIGSIQLRQFGAQIYVADMVGIAMAREMAPIMVGVIMAGRTGAAFAAQLGTMQVNEEIDALRTLGLSPVDVLVMPRMVSLILMLPVLTLYGLAAGILGGSLVGFMALDVTFWQYIYRTWEAVQLVDMWIGLSKGFVFGILVAICGCYFGMKCGRNASSVGLAATSAVVSGIVCIVISDAVFAFVCNILEI